MRSIESSNSEDGEMVYKIAQAYAQLDDSQSSLRLLRKSIDLNFYPYTYVATDPLLEPVRREPEYDAVIAVARQHQVAFWERRR